MTRIMGFNWRNDWDMNFEDFDYMREIWLIGGWNYHRTLNFD